MIYYQPCSDARCRLHQRGLSFGPNVFRPGILIPWAASLPSLTSAGVQTAVLQKRCYQSAMARSSR